MKKVVCLLIAVGFLNLNPDSVMAQEQDLGINPNSIRPIHENDIMYKKRVWRRMDLKEKQNKGFFSVGNEITKIIIEAVKRGLLYPYDPKNDSLNIRFTKEQFLERIRLPDEGGGLSEEEKALGFSEDDGGWGDEGDGFGDAGPAEEVEEEVLEFLPSQITTLEIMEDAIFDKKRSRLYYDIQSIKLIIPAGEFETGLIRPVAVFKFKDLVELWKNMPGEAIWFNPQNSREHRNLADAFDLRLFSSRIIKVENPDDNFIVDVYSKSPKEGVMASQWYEDDLIQYEHDLWEF
ncbi:MAG: gliding motility protein GldN [Bacteroidetes bacterium]|nr:gliding motility protein GldN [Bacteroidota bacterium]